MTESKPEFKPEFDKPHKWATEWLGADTSVTDIDLAASGNCGINVYQIKYRTPFVTKAQFELLTKHKLEHIVILNFKKPERKDGKYDFEAPDEIQQGLLGMESPSIKPYKIYCPHAKQEVEYVEHRRSQRITSPPQAYLTKSEARAIFRGDAPWPCCGRPTFPR